MSTTKFTLLSIETNSFGWQTALNANKRNSGLHNAQFIFFCVKIKIKALPRLSCYSIATNNHIVRA